MALKTWRLRRMQRSKALKKMHACRLCAMSCKLVTVCVAYSCSRSTLLGLVVLFVRMGYKEATINQLRIVAAIGHAGHSPIA